MLRWLVKFIDEKKDSWEEERRENIKKSKEMKDWSQMSRDERIENTKTQEQLSEKEIWFKYRDCNTLQAQMTTVEEDQNMVEQGTSYRETINIEEMTCRAPCKPHVDISREASKPGHSEGAGKSEQNLEASKSNECEIMISSSRHQFCRWREEQNKEQGD